MSCFGDGKCMKLCTNRVCLQKHQKSRFTYCKTECENECELIPCKNVVHCKSAFPAYCYKKSVFITNGTCNICNIFNITFLKEKRKCLMCSNVKYMIVTKCQHEFCFDCLFRLDQENTRCPFCGSDIEANSL
jgi:hypothetical protein